jgi:hypothetical protein
LRTTQWKDVHLPLLLFSNRFQKIVISTEAAHSFIVSRAVEKPAVPRQLLTRGLLS